MILLLILPHFVLKELEFSVMLGSLLDGDVNSDGVVNILDVVLMVNMVLGNGYDEIADMNGDGELNILDIVFFIDVILYP